MFRYIALIADQGSASQLGEIDVLCKKLARGATTWRQVTRLSKVRVYCAGGRAGFLESQVSRDGKVTILGRLFARSSASVASRLSDTELNDTFASRARNLVDEYWGAYVSLVHDPDSGATWVVRDPSGQLRCFVTRWSNVLIVCSDVDDCVGLGAKFSINWNYVIGELTRYARMGWVETGLTEVTALSPGQCVKFCAAGAQTTVYWDPVRIAKEPIEDTSTAVEQVRVAVQTCVQSWANCHDRVLLMLSGGIDSSVILACLRDPAHRPEIVCANMHYPSLYGDERRYARRAAEMAGVRLVEVERSTEGSMDRLLSLPRTARPANSNSDYAMFGEQWTRMAREYGASALIVGHMGDQLFCQHPDARVVVDAVRRHGVGARALNVAFDFGRASGNPALRAFLWASWHGLLGRLGSSQMLSRSIPKNPYVDYAALSHLDYRYVHRWESAVQGLPPGKLLHVASICGASALFAPHGRSTDPEWLIPLYSQPVIELCLRMPMYLLIHGGWDRAILRRAFAKDLPREIIGRRLKGAQGNRTRMLANSRPFIRDMLLDGILVARRVLKRPALERIILDDAKDLNDVNLLRCLWTEIWLRRWIEGSSGARGSDREWRLDVTATN